MTRGLTVALYIVVIAAVIVGVDVLFFRGTPWPRLIANLAIVAAFALLYLAVVRKP